VLRLGAEWERFSFGLPDGAPLPDTLQAVNLVIGLDTQLSDSILIRVEAQPGVYDAGFDDLSDDFNAPFVVGGTYIFSPNLQLVLGVSVDIERKYPVIPAVGIRWKMAPQWVLNAVLPTPRLEFEVNNGLTLYAGANLKQANYRVDDHFGDNTGNVRLNHAVLTYTEVRTGAGIDWKISPVVTLTAEIGYQPYREFDFYRTEVGYRQDGGAPYGTISLHGAF
jgi:opacity protein-like surface antigen